MKDGQARQLDGPGKGLYAPKLQGLKPTRSDRRMSRLKPRPTKTIRKSEMTSRIEAQQKRFLRCERRRLRSLRQAIDPLPRAPKGFAPARAPSRPHPLYL